jgi:NADPH-ferrihemoprotein reductase
VEFDVSQCKGLTYETGDHLGVFAENAPDVVDRVCKLLKVSKQTPMELVRRDDAPKSLLPVFPGPISVGIAVARYADVLSMPRKTAIKALASFATNKKEAKELDLLAVDKAKYHAYVADPHRSLLEVMEKFPSAVPTLGAFFGCVAGRLQPRYYSISSSPKDVTNGSGIVTATVAVVKHKTKTGRVHEGVCSTFLQNVREGDRVPVFVRKATFKLPKDVKAPVILIGPGTGYAPFRGFLQEREYLLKSKKQELGECMLFFGCRKEEHDYIYRDEMENALSEKVITSLDVAFSRDDPKKKVYVQDKIQMKAKDEAQTARCTCAETPSTCPGMSTEPCCKYYNAKANTRYTKPRKSFVD